jgi:hypothetical protein
METNHDIKPIIGSAYQLLQQNNYYYYFKKVLLLFFELLNYLIALLFLIGIFIIPNSSIEIVETLDENITIRNTVEWEELNQVIFLFKIVLAFIFLLFLCFGLFLGYIRRKNNRIRQAVLYLEEALGNMY